MHRPGAPWAWRGGGEDVPAALVAALGRWPSGELLATLLWQRGIVTVGEATDFLEPTLARGLRPPSALAGVPGAGEALAAIARTEPSVAIAPRGGAAGLVGAAVLADWLGALGCKVAVDPGVEALLQVGSDEIQVAGLAVPVCVADPPLAAAGLAFYVCAAARAARRLAGESAGPELRRLVDLVALGTVIAGRPLRAENRVLVTAGLRRWREEARPGLRALADAAAIEVPTSRLVAARLGPRLEAAAAAASDALAALLTTSSADEARARAAAVEVAAAARRVPRTGDGEERGGGPILLDAEVPLDRLTPGLLVALARLEPHGAGNPEPVFLARDVRVDGIRLGGDPLRPWWRLRLRQEGRTRRATAMGMAGAPPPPGSRCDLAYVPRLAADGVRTAVELEVRGLCACLQGLPAHRGQ